MRGLCYAVILFDFPDRREDSMHDAIYTQAPSDHDPWERLLFWPTGRSGGLKRAAVASAIADHLAKTGRYPRKRLPL